MSNLQVKEFNGISIDCTVKYAVCHDNFYLYSDVQNNIYALENNVDLTSAPIKLPSCEKKVTGTVTSLDFSPSRKFAASGYSDGYIQLFDLESKPYKPSKLIQKPGGVSVQSIIFYSDSIFIATYSDGSLFRIKKSLFNLSMNKDMTILNAVNVFRPTVYSYVSGNAKIILPNFVNILAISTEDSFFIYTTDKESNLSKQIFSVNHGRLIPCFKTQDQTVLMGLLYPDKVEVYTMKYEGELKVEEIATIPTVAPIKFLTFLSSVILFGHDENCEKFSLIYTDNKSVNEIDSKIEQTISKGKFIQGGSNNGPVFFKDKKLFSLTCQSFIEKMESFNENPEVAIDFCMKAIANDPIATSGLISNKNQQLLVIEKSISPILSNYLSSQLNANPENAAEIADKFIAISLKLKLQDWPIETAFSYFAEKKAEGVFAGKIISADPNAINFSYNRTFVEFIVSNVDAISDKELTGNFLFCLPTQILPLKEFIAYANKTKNFFLLSQIFSNRLNNIENALQILANAGMYSKLCTMIIYNQPKIEISLRWSFTYINDKFPIIEKLCQVKEAEDIFPLFEETIREKETINFSDYVNAMIQTLYPIFKENGSDGTTFIGKHLNKMEKLVYSEGSKVSLLPSTLKCLISHIFSKKLEPNDSQRAHFEEILRHIFSSRIDDELKKILVQLCKSFDYEKIIKEMAKGKQKYGTMINTFLFKSNNTFEDLRNLLSNCNEVNLCKQCIQDSFISYAPYYIVKDVDKFSEFLIENFPENPDLISSIISKATDENMRNIFIKNIYTRSKSKYDPNIFEFQNQKEIIINFVDYLAKYYPEEVLDFIQLNESKDITNMDLIDKCKKYHIYDASAYLLEKFGYISESSDYIIKYQQIELMRFAQDKTDKSTAERTYNFIKSIIQRRKNREFDSTQRMLKQLVQSMVAPIYELQTKSNHNNSSDQEKIAYLNDYLKRLCTLASQYVAFTDLLEVFTNGFFGIEFGLTKSFLTSIINDFSYDIDMSISIHDLQYVEEANVQSSLILDNIHGTRNDNLTCLACHQRLIGSLCKVQIFPCGHAFHYSCLSTETCPVCNPEVKISHELQPTQYIPSKNTHLKLFEIKLGRNSSVFRKEENEIERKGFVKFNSEEFCQLKLE